MATKKVKPKIEFNEMSLEELQAIQKQLADKVRFLEAEERAAEERAAELEKQRLAETLQNRTRVALARIAILDSEIQERISEIEDILDAFKESERPHYTLEVGGTSFDREYGNWTNSYQ